ncbi:hypothetical protein DFP72DRAFT_829181, partial [Ephemerocybe angulata]
HPSTIRPGSYWVISSPNINWIPRPPSGFCEVHAFADGHYGYDDRALFPQFYASGFEYYSCIPRRCPELDPLFVHPTRADCPIIPGAVDLDVRILLESSTPP